MQNPREPSSRPPAAHTDAKRYVLRELPIPAGESDPDLLQAVATFLRLKKNRLGDLRIVRKSLDSRRRNQPLWRYAVEFTFDGPIKHPKVSLVNTSSPKGESGKRAAGGTEALRKYRPGGPRVAVIGSGPAGLSAALGLTRKGYQVQVFEQGNDVRKRFQDIRQFFKGNVFNPHSNILFGEGGAGTFSDGKLTHRTRTVFTEAFLQELVASGADADIAYLSHPHIGTDKLQFIIKGFRERCEALGCRFHFNTKVDDLVIRNGHIAGLVIAKGEAVLTGAVVGESGNPASHVVEPFDAVVLAAGHSARPLYGRLLEHGVAMDRKTFSIGVRVEHPQAMVNKRQLGDKVDATATGAAEYFLTWNSEDQGSSAYSFCMCPGGVVVPCADAADGLFTNGMSYSNRAGAFANSAVVVPVTPEELSGSGVLAGLDLIRELEIKAFQLGGGDFVFPAQTIQAFMDNRSDEGPAPRTSFPKPVKWVNFRGFFPAKVDNALQESFRNFDRKLPGFITSGLIIGPESRTSSPVRILRDTVTLESTSTPGLFPLGEGAGYSGGIVSSGADGLRLADAWENWASVKPANAPGTGQAAASEPASGAA